MRDNNMSVYLKARCPKIFCCFDMTVGQCAPAGTDDMRAYSKIIKCMRNDNRRETIEQGKYGIGMRDIKPASQSREQFIYNPIISPHYDKSQHHYNRWNDKRNE